MEKLATVVFVCFQMWGLDTLFVNVVLLCYIYLFQNIGMHFQALPGSLAMSSYPCTEALKSSWTFCGTLINDCHSFKEWTMLFLSLFFFFSFLSCFYTFIQIPWILDFGQAGKFPLANICYPSHELQRMTLLEGCGCTASPEVFWWVCTDACHQVYLMFSNRVA